MRFWWASQNKNYSVAIPAGTLWTRPRINNVLPRERAALQELEVDDVVFHYGRPYVRAVSRVVATAVDHVRPDGYPRGPRETAAHDAGKLARVELIANDLHLDSSRVAELVRWGSPGPLSRFGVPREAYLTPLEADDAHRLLQALDVELPKQSLPGRPHENWQPGGGTTDAIALGTIRREQTALRNHLLAGRTFSACSICGRDLPADLLVASHILPRSELSEEERADFDSVAMLLCQLGCDALFEHGYLTVKSDGVIAPGPRTPIPTVSLAIKGVAGQACQAWNGRTAPFFSAHRQRSEQLVAGEMERASQR